MTRAGEGIDLGAAVSLMDGEMTLPGLHAPLIIRRDGFGVAHIRATDEHDAWFGQGFAAAQDRLWQMEYDRLRATGRWAEAAGVSAVPADLLARRLQLGRVARADVDAMSTETRAMFDAYADGVNAFLDSGQPLPVEYELTGLTPEAWQPWHSVAAFKVRHVLMGGWQQKVAQARLLAVIGPRAYARLDTRPPAGSAVIMPPGGAVAQLFEQAEEEIRDAAEQLGFMAEAQAGSNSWAVHGSRTTTGMPVLCNDSHRALDVPSVYWQVHVACPEFDVIGATFPGVPGFPHFGHNGHVAWNITHTSADYQDLYIERFDPNDHTRYRVPEGAAPSPHPSPPASPAERGAASVPHVGAAPSYLSPPSREAGEGDEGGGGGGDGDHSHLSPLSREAGQGSGEGAAWAVAECAVETIVIRGGGEVQLEVWRTRHGPVVHGDPRNGVVLSLRYTATDGPCRGFEVLRPMLRARTVAELHETQRAWVDPVNNLVSADTSGNIGYLTRGALPIRSSQAHRQFPAPGWSGEHEWIGRVPFVQLPQAINPPEGFIATANQAVIPGDQPYIAHQFAPPSRADRLVELLTAKERLTPEEVIAMQGDVLSRPARAWARLLARSGPFEVGDPALPATRDNAPNLEGAEQARSMLAGWDGNLLPESGEALLYAYVRREVARALFEPVVGGRMWQWLTSEAVPALGRMISHWLANVIASLDSGSPTTFDGRAWNDILPAALAGAWRSAVKKAGPDPSTWRWAEHHSTNARHTLSATFPTHAAALNPARAAVGGDSDTLQCAAYGWSGRTDFDINALSVYRQAVDLTDIGRTSFIVPAGVSGLPGTPHYGDQLEHWRTHRRIPAHYTEADVAAATVQTLRLAPG